jgi:hypothetical protein
MPAPSFWFADRRQQRVVERHLGLHFPGTGGVFAGFLAGKFRGGHCRGHRPVQDEGQDKYVHDHSFVDNSAALSAWSWAINKSLAAGKVGSGLVSNRSPLRRPRSTNVSMACMSLINHFWTPGRCGRLSTCRHRPRRRSHRPSSTRTRRPHRYFPCGRRETNTLRPSLRAPEPYPG